MKLVRQSHEMLSNFQYEEVLRAIERSTRLCYKSENRMHENSAEPLVRSIIGRGHHAMIEHFSFTVRFVTDRGVSHELVRHRVASYAQESTRYCNYSKGSFGGHVAFVIPVEFESLVPDATCDGPRDAALDRISGGAAARKWLDACRHAEVSYLGMLSAGSAPGLARSVLPNSLKTEIDVTANIREWRHILALRTSKAAHPQMQALMLPLLDRLKTELPLFFEDINAGQEG